MKLIDALDTPGPREFLCGIRRGIEKESLRVASDGTLAQTPHPSALGSALTHSNITTDFSEAQLELITDVHSSVDAVLAQLEEIHAWVYRNLGDEILWGASMPCMLRGDDTIPLGDYGTSNIGTAKTVYRRGLGHRYGRLMQTISGIHYNFSMPDDFWPWLADQTGWKGDLQELATERYFGMLRNFRRTSWLLLYLFGASPAVCKSFLAGRDHELEAFDEGSLHRPFATSLRMGGIGYQSSAQSSVHVSFNSLQDYARSMEAALVQPWPEYEAIGLERDGEFQQLSTSLLQIENEFYGTIRPKRTIRSGERALHALGARGVEYVEVRLMDLNPFLPLGIDGDTMRFLDAYLLHCLLKSSPEDSLEELEMMQRNRTTIVERGRAPDTELETPEGARSLQEWGTEILDACRRVANAMDTACACNRSLAAVELQEQRLGDAAQTPSAQILDQMRTREQPFFVLAMEASRAHAEHFRTVELSETNLARLQRESRESIIEQRRMESMDTMDFATYRQHYINQPLLPGHEES